MRVISYDPYNPAATHSLDDLLAEADAVSMHAPVLPETTGMIGPDQFARMKDGAIYLNTARAHLHDTDALVGALESGHLGGAGVDVTEVEPLPPDSKLWGLPNVIITPHVGGQAATRIDDMTDFFCNNLSRYLTGSPLVNLVDKALGFPLPDPPAP